MHQEDSRLPVTAARMNTVNSMEDVNCSNSWNMWYIISIDLLLASSYFELNLLRRKNGPYENKSLVIFHSIGIGYSPATGSNTLQISTPCVGIDKSIQYIDSVLCGDALHSGRDAPMMFRKLTHGSLYRNLSHWLWCREVICEKIYADGRYLEN